MRIPALLPFALLLGLMGCGGSDLVSSTGNGVVVTVAPSAVTLNAGNAQLFTATLTGTRNQAVTWAAVGGGSSGVFLGQTGAYTAPALPGTYTIVATSSADPTAAGTATVTVTGANGLAITPSSAVVGLGRSVQLAAVSTDPVPVPVNVSWALKTPGAGGSISSSGLYLAVSTAGSSTSSSLDVVVATLLSNTSVTATVPILVSPVVLDPDRTGVRPGGTITFTAQPTAGVTGGMIWSAQYFSSMNALPLDVTAAITPTAGATIPTAVFTAPGYGSGFYKVRATSVSYPATFGEGTVTIQ